MIMKESRIVSFLMLAVLLLVLTACGGGSEQENNLAATQAALEATQAALEAGQIQAGEHAESGGGSEDTEDEDASGGTGILSGSEAEADSSDDAEPYYIEEWDEANPNWSYFLVRGEENEFDLYTEDGQLVWYLPETYVWLYVTYDAYIYEDIVVETHVRNLGQNSNNVSLICRYSDRGWYEFNIANSGLYWIYRYETASNEFVQLYNGGSEAIKIGVGENTYAAVCEGNELSLYINGEHTRTVTDLHYLEGQAGVGVSSFDLVPVEILMDYVGLYTP
jgi:hypothetical protein